MATYAYVCMHVDEMDVCISTYVCIIISHAYIHNDDRISGMSTFFPRIHTRMLTGMHTSCTNMHILCVGM